MSIIAFQIFLVLIILMSSTLGRKARNVVAFIVFIFSLINVFVPWLLVVQILVIAYAVHISDRFHDFGDKYPPIKHLIIIVLWLITITLASNAYTAVSFILVYYSVYISVILTRLSINRFIAYKASKGHTTFGSGNGYGAGHGTGAIARKQTKYDKYKNWAIIPVFIVIFTLTYNGLLIIYVTLSLTFGSFITYPADLFMNFTLSSYIKWILEFFRVRLFPPYHWFIATYYNLKSDIMVIVDLFIKLFISP